MIPQSGERGKLDCGTSLPDPETQQGEFRAIAPGDTFAHSGPYGTGHSKRCGDYVPDWDAALPALEDELPLRIGLAQAKYYQP